jgi:hypothetical protein
MAAMAARDSEFTPLRSFDIGLSRAQAFCYTAAHRQERRHQHPS